MHNYSKIKGLDSGKITSLPNLHASFQSSPKINRMLFTRLICIQWKLSLFSSPVSTVSARNAWPTMNDFPVMRKGLWDRQGANIASRCKEMYDVELAASLDTECCILSWFCEMQRRLILARWNCKFLWDWAINSNDKHSFLRKGRLWN